MNIGDKINMLTILEKHNTKKNIYFLCQCECGNQKLIRKSHLLNGQISCGCERKKILSEIHIKHGMYGTRIYKIWSSMKDRCDKTSKNSKWYKDIGITYDERWKDFINFYEDMKENYSDELTLDRIDTKQNYTKNNCRWITYEQQQLNKTNNHLIEINGIIKPATQWAKEFNIKPVTLIKRHNNGWYGEKLLQPVKGV